MNKKERKKKTIPFISEALPGTPNSGVLLGS